MPIATGRYGDTAPTVGHRLYWLRRNLARLIPHRDGGGGYSVHREWGRWTLRPASGWRSLRWITPAPHTTRTVPKDDRDAALDWGLEVTTPTVGS